MDVDVGGEVLVGGGVFVRVGIRVFVGEGVMVGEGVIVGVRVAVGVFVAVDVLVGVLVLVGVGKVRGDAGLLILQEESLNEIEKPKLFAPKLNGGFMKLPLNPPAQSMYIVFVVFTVRSNPKLVVDV